MSNIEWTNKTWNPLAGCTPVSPGCLNCYAARMAMRLEGMGTKGYQPIEEPMTAKEIREAHAAVGGGKLHDHERVKEIRIAEVTNGRPVFTGSVRTIPDKLTDPLHLRKPSMIFVNSMSDLFHEAVPFEFIDQVFAVMALCPQHTFQVLTKRPERMAEYLQGAKDSSRLMLCKMMAEGFNTRGSALMACVQGVKWPLPNVWLGTSVEDQAAADERIPHLLRRPAAVRFLSCEPLLGAVDLSAFFGGPYVGMPGDVVHPNYNFGIHWIIAGGESGPKSRPCNIEWIRSIVQQCKAAGVPCFVKQLGAKPIGEWGDDTYPRHHLTVVGLGGFSGIVPSRRKNGQWLLSDRKGGTPSEWPQDLRVREMPRAGLRHQESGIGPNSSPAPVPSA